MEISAPVPQELRPWRTATLVASGVAAFELVILLIIGIALIGKPLSASAKEAAITHAIGAGNVPSRPEPRHTSLSRTQTSVLILNGNGVAGAAAAAAARLRQHGYVATRTGNAPRTYGRSTVMYRPGRLPEAKRLARDLGVSLVGPLDGVRLRQLRGAQVVIVLGS